MPVAQATVKRNPLPAGEHVLCLVSVEEVEQPAFEDPTKQVTRWIWQFKAKAVDPETGDRYEFRQYTGPLYGNSRAGLTILLDQMLPDWTDEQKSTIDTDKILQTYYNALIRHEKAEKAGDPPKPRLVLIEPYKKAKSAAPAAPAPVEDDPYATDEDEFDAFDTEQSAAPVAA